MNQAKKWIATSLVISMTGFLFQGCGKQAEPVPYTGSNASLQGGQAGQNFTDTICTSKGDVDINPKDGICDKEGLPLGPDFQDDDKCANKENCAHHCDTNKGFGICSVNTVAVVLGTLALGWLARSCINGAAGCDLNPFNSGGEAQKGLRDSSGNLKFATSAQGVDFTTPPIVDGNSILQISAKDSSGGYAAIKLWVVVQLRDKIRLANNSSGDQINVCINTHFGIGKTSDALKATYQMVINNAVLTSTVANSIGDIGNEEQCFTQKSGDFIKVTTTDSQNPSKNAELFNKAVNPIGFGFASPEGSKVTYSAPSYVLFDELLTSKQGIYFQSATNSASATNKFMLNESDVAAYNSYSTSVVTTCESFTDTTEKAFCRQQGAMGSTNVELPALSRCTDVGKCLRYYIKKISP